MTTYLPRSVTLGDGNLKDSNLSISHYNQLKQSAIADDIIAESKIETVTNPNKLKDLGFKPYQCKVPAILFPFYGVEGHIVNYQIKPDLPRSEVKPSGKIHTIKYEYPANSKNYLYCHPRYQKQLADPSIALWFTEGIKKGLSLTSAGVCALALIGVNSYRGKNKHGGKMIIPDFQYIALNGRDVYLCFDSDAWNNPDVCKALIELAAILEQKKAIVHIIKLPHSEDKKTGIDDYLAQGHTLDDVLTLETDERPTVHKPNNPTNEYKIISNSFHFVKETKEGESDTVLTNFIAKIDEEIIKDDGIDITRHYSISGIGFDGRNFPAVETPVDKFKSLAFVNEWGLRAIIAAGNGVADKVREAIQSISMDAEVKTIYKHTGFREVDGNLVFLTHQSAIGSENISVDLEPQLRRYSLPQPDGHPTEAIKASLNFLNIGNFGVLIPIYAAMFLAPLSSILHPNFTLWYEGISGSFKSVVGSLALSHYGDFNYTNLPASWRDTANQLEKFQSVLKDMPLYIDDFAPGSDVGKQRELEAKAEHIIRGQGNLQGKARMKADTSSRLSYTPRGLTISSGEQLPSGYSQSARTVVVEIERADIKVSELSQAQKDAYLYPVAMSHFIQWLITKYESLKIDLPSAFNDWRTKVLNKDCHARLPGPITMLYIGLDQWLTFAVENKAIAAREATVIRDKAWKTLNDLGIDQSKKVNKERPSEKFLNALKALLESKQVILLDRNTTTEYQLKPGQSFIGWNESETVSDYLYLVPELTYKAVYEFCQKSGKPLTISPEAVWKDMKIQGLIETKQPDRNTYAVRVPREGNKIKFVIKLKGYSCDIQGDKSDDE